MIGLGYIELDSENCMTVAVGFGIVALMCFIIPHWRSRAAKRYTVSAAMFFRKTA